METEQYQAEVLRGGTDSPVSWLWCLGCLGVRCEAPPTLGISYGLGIRKRVGLSLCLWAGHCTALAGM